MLSAVCFVSLQKVNKKSANDNVLSRLNTFFQKKSWGNGLDTLFHQRVLYVLRVGIVLRLSLKDAASKTK